MLSTPINESRKLRLPSGIKVYQSIVGNRALKRLHKTRTRANDYVPLVIKRYEKLKVAAVSG